jgi:hypothetical protein
MVGAWRRWMTVVAKIETQTRPTFRDSLNSVLAFSEPVQLASL